MSTRTHWPKHSGSPLRTQNINAVAPCCPADALDSMNGNAIESDLSKLKYFTKGYTLTSNSLCSAKFMEAQVAGLGELKFVVEGRGCSGV